MSVSEPGGLLLIDKQRGPTSADIVRSISRLIGKKNKIGHAGTLDPDATGLLVILIGGATRLSDHVMQLPKIYRAVIRFGIQTDTYDAMGAVVAEKDASGITEENVAAILPKFMGNIMQKPPAYSAVKIAGKRAYDLARQGKLEDLPEREAIIHELRLELFSNPEVTVYVRCGKGTYLRTLAHDMGHMLGVGAHVKALRRLGIGSFEPTVNLAELTLENWRERLVNGAKIFEGQPVFELNARGALNLRRGIPIRATDFKTRPVEPAGLLTGVLDEEGNLIAVAKIGIGGTLMDRKILQPL
ncbi:MAG: tRNA pseudouridine(55) synthase TruB [Candidatus Hydrogenedentota bacterium]